MEDDTVIIRNRDTMLQDRIKVSELKEYIESRISF